MLVRYADEDLESLAVNTSFRSDMWDQDLVRSYRQRHQSLKAAKDREDLCAMRCLDLRPEIGRHDACTSIRLVHSARLLLNFDAPTSDEVTLVSIVKADVREVAP